MKLLYFASFREALGVSEETLDLPAGVTTVADLLDVLHVRGENWLKTLSKNKSILIAVNQEMAQWETNINRNDEVAFFPPVTGG